MAMYASSPFRNALAPTMPAPAPMADASEAAYAPGTTVSAPTGNALATISSPAMPSSQGSPFMQAKGPPRNALAASAIDGFMRGFAPQQWQQTQDREKADSAEKAKQTLALMQQQRALPEQQRGQWWQQNAPTISEIVGQDVSAMPLDVSKFSDQALDGQIAALSAQLGIAPEKPDAMSAYEAEQIRLKELELKAGPKPQIFSTSKGLVEAAPGQDPRLVYDTEPEEKPPWTGAVKDANGNWIYDPDYIAGEQRMRAASSSGSGGDKVSLGYRMRADGTGWEPVPGGPADKGRTGQIPFDQIRAEQSMADDWTRVQNDFDEVNSQYERVKSLGNLANRDKNSQSAADLALITTITKMLDPTSVAREGEVKLTQSSAALWQTVENLPNQWQYGQTTLPPEQRTALLRMADTLMPSYKKAYQNRLNSVYKSASDYGFSPERAMPGADLKPFAPKPVITPFGGTGEWNLDAFKGLAQPQGVRPQQGAYQPGAIDVDEDTGEQYRFKGGDPTDQRNWEPVR